EAQLREAGKSETSYVFDGRDHFVVAFARREAGGFTVVFRRAATPPPAKAPSPPPARAPSPPPMLAPSPPPTLAPSPPPSEAVRAPATSRFAPESSLRVLLERAVALGASDLHLCSGEPPSLRIDGRLRLAAELTPVSVEELFAGPLVEVAGVIAAGRSADIAVDVPSLGRFRVNLYRAADRLVAAVRVLMRAAPSMADLHFPLSFDDVIDVPHGIVIVTGPTGSGKSATLSALAAEAVRRRGALLISLEDPVEYAIAAAPPALVRQRQIGRDVRDFPTGLRDALREDPDILLIGEMRDPDTISLALTAAETGHLVLTSLHSRSAASSVERIVDAYPPGRQQQIRVQLADALRAVVAQRLVPRAHGAGRVPAVEILRGTHSVASLIREGKTAQLTSVLQSSRKEGMLPLERCLADMVRGGQITRDAAIAVANEPTSLQSYLSS
ncbi:MAG: Twitching motility protein PilT, partial [bacterium]|nr:Twitching motility protein PilT [bacterium]